MYEFCIADIVDGHIFAKFFKASFRFGELSVFSASISWIRLYCIGFCYLVLLSKRMNCIFDATFFVKA